MDSGKHLEALQLFTKLLLASLNSVEANPHHQHFSKHHYEVLLCGASLSASLCSRSPLATQYKQRSQGEAKQEDRSQDMADPHCPTCITGEQTLAVQALTKKQFANSPNSPNSPNRPNNQQIKNLMNRKHRNASNLKTNPFKIHTCGEMTEKTKNRQKATCPAPLLFHCSSLNLSRQRAATCENEAWSF